MDSSMNESYSAESEETPATPKVIKMSPITNLAHNLSGLTTSVAGTPMRRISWSNPIPGGDKIGLDVENLSPYSNTDSPVASKTILQSIITLRSRHQQMLKPGREVVPSDSDDENKENIDSESNGGTKPIPIKSAFSYREQLDSGYSSISFSSKLSFDSPSPFTSQKNSYHADDVYFDELGYQELSSVPESMSSLLNKPLKESLKSPKPPTVGVKRSKLPMRRCLSMEVGFDPAAGPSTSKIQTCPNHAVSSSDQDSDECCNFKRPDPPADLSGLQSKRRRSSPSINLPSRTPCRLFRSFSETTATIMHAILKSDLQPELIGDGSRLCALPLIKGRHSDLMSIAPPTLARLINGEFKDVDSYVVVDCRYPYEFEGGHILGAKNIYTKEAVMEEFLTVDIDTSKRNIIIFHCEFSSERAPTLCRFLRNKDRVRNEGNYPQLHHPEIYILEGGYKAFFSAYKELCEPQAYKPMHHKDHSFELRHFRAKSKSWGADSKGRSQLRSKTLSHIGS